MGYSFTYRPRCEPSLSIRLHTFRIWPFSRTNTGTVIATLFSAPLRISVAHWLTQSSRTISSMVMGFGLLGPSPRHWFRTSGNTTSSAPCLAARVTNRAASSSLASKLGKSSYVRETAAMRLMFIPSTIGFWACFNQHRSHPPIEVPAHSGHNSWKDKEEDEP